ncbi:MAG TPA: ArsA-related P-loop ATPase [Candidatus Acidoferrales bacterium]|nr:ArsA-related P-loop ATPase [Candidatus Acidoferrales bacterium]
MKPARVVFVTGKGGTGKSTLAAAIAIALSRRSHTTIVDLDGRQCAASMIGGTVGRGTPARVTESLDATAVGGREELEAFIERIVPLRAISRRMLRSRTFGYVTAALPGLEAFLLLERLRIMAADAALEDRYLVVDAPASGSAIELLSVATGIQKLAPTGTLNRLADSVRTFLCDATRFGVIITATPDELAIREALETAEAMRGQLGVAVLAAMMNRVPDSLFDTAELAALSLLGAHARLAVARSAARESALIGAARLAEAGLETVVMPMMFTPQVSVEEVEALSDVAGAGLFD